MTRQALTNTLEYHRQTIHHPHRYARSAGYLDWANQPDPFRRFKDAPTVQMPIPTPSNEPKYAEIYRNGAVLPAKLSFQKVSELFYLSFALSAWKSYGQNRWSLRCNPSSGNLHPTESYTCLPSMENLCDQPAVYHYTPQLHALERRKTLQPSLFQQLMQNFPPCALLIALTSIHYRESWKYGERAFRYCQHDIGHALAACRLAAATLGWAAVALEDLGDEDIAALLGLNREEDFAGAEVEHPDVVMAVWPAQEPCEIPTTLDPEVLREMADGEWTGRANRLSGEHVEWDIIDEVARATGKPRTEARKVKWQPLVAIGHPDEAVRAPGCRSDKHADPGPGGADSTAAAGESTTGQPSRVEGSGSGGDSERSVSAFQIIRQRRSAVAYDGQTRLPADGFFRMLQRVMPGEPPAPPWDAVQWRPSVHLLLFVHLVDGLPPGLYVLVRDRGQVDDLREGMDRPGFAWSRPEGCPEDLPLFHLETGDARRAAAQLSLGQEIAGLGAYSLGMLADFAMLDTHGPWFYRRLFWESGMIGQVLYLEAEAAGIRATGIGAYFDDLVHELVGLKERRFQSIYHFTMGGAVEDTRLTTLPGYPSEQG